MCTIATLLQIRDIFAEKERIANIPIIPELVDPRTSLQVSAIRCPDFLEASRLPSQILAMIAYEPRIAHGLEEFLSEHGHVSFKVKTIDRFCRPNEDAAQILSPKRSTDSAAPSITFQYLSALISRDSNEVLIGWSLPADETVAVKACLAEGNKGEFHRMIADWCETVHPDMPSLEWEINPKDKHQSRAWTSNDRVLVLSPHSWRHKSLAIRHGVP